MRKLEDLGISPYPWKVAKHVEKTTGLGYENINSSDCAYVADGTTKGDRHLIAAAPEMYEALREAVIANCRDCPNCGGYPKYGCKKPDCECFPAEWRAVLAKAAGEEARND